MSENIENNYCDVLCKLWDDDERHFYILLRIMIVWKTKRDGNMACICFYDFLMISNAHRSEKTFSSTCVCGMFLIFFSPYLFFLYSSINFIFFLLIFLCSYRLQMTLKLSNPFRPMRLRSVKRILIRWHLRLSSMNPMFMHLRHMLFLKVDSLYFSHDLFV